MKLKVALAVLLSHCGACVSTGGVEELPAVIVATDAASRAELQQVVARALNRDRVVLAADALMRESELVLEPASVRDLGGRVQGRELRSPERFRLVKVGGDCVLIHDGSGRRFPLTHTKCAARKD